MAKIPDGWDMIRTGTVPRYHSSADFPTTEKLLEVMRTAQEKLAALRASPDYATDLLFTQEVWDRVRPALFPEMMLVGRPGGYAAHAMDGINVYVFPTLAEVMVLWTNLRAAGRVPKIVTMGADNAVLLGEAPADAPLHVPAPPGD